MKKNISPKNKKKVGSGLLVSNSPKETAEEIDILVGDVPGLDFEPVALNDAVVAAKTCPICEEEASLGDGIACRKCGYIFFRKETYTP